MSGPAISFNVAKSMLIFEPLEVELMPLLRNPTVSHYVALAIVTVVTLIVSVISYYATRAIVMGIVSRIAKRTRTEWDNFLVERRFFPRLSHLAPAVVIYFAQYLFPVYRAETIERISMGYMVLVGILTATSFLDVVGDIYGTLKMAKSNPVKGFVQGAKLFVYMIGGVFLLAKLLGQDPWALVASIGAVTAVLLLVFKDTILGLVASFQIIANDLVHIGDWIEMPKYGADGDVLDITLTSIKVQNWDNTITTIPTYALIADSFKNWRGMQESQGRRIKRSINIDMTSVTFLTNDLLQRFEKFALLSEYIRKRRSEVADYNAEHNIDTSEVINGRRLTNLGTFRAYLKAYLRHHSKIHQELTLLVRHLSPTAEGIPVEIYVFSSDKAWANYEDIQADIFDHILAVLPEFGLRVFQQPTGIDMRTIGRAA